MSSVHGVLLTCDRCERAIFLTEDETAPGWDSRSFTGDLCPDCLADLERLLDDFMKGSKNENK